MISVQYLISYCTSMENYYPYRAFGGQNEIVYYTGFLIFPGQYFLILPGLYVTNHLTLIYVYDMS